jgi:hypothetical protein
MKNMVAQNNGRLHTKMTSIVYNFGCHPTCFSASLKAMGS